LFLFVLVNYVVNRSRRGFFTLTATVHGGAVRLAVAAAIRRLRTRLLSRVTNQSGLDCRFLIASQNDDFALKL
jgi:hypothetical protein